MSFEINLFIDIRYYHTNQHSSIDTVGVPSESLILKVLPIEVNCLIDLGGLTSVCVEFEYLGLSSAFLLIIWKNYNPES